MRIAADLHIHSCLSPCADNNMTPGNIVGMAKLKGLDAIAVTDHNHTGNLASAFAAAKKNGILLIPGLEVQSKEEVHLLCYFESVYQASAFGEKIFKTLKPVANRPSLFGRQILMDEDDQEIGDLERLLIQSSGLSISQIVQEVNESNGVVIPAHINRHSNSLLTMLGFIPPGLGFQTVEISPQLVVPNLYGYKMMYNSDAHELGAILEREVFLDIEENNTASVIDCLKKGI